SMVGSEIVNLGNAIRERIRQGDTIYNFPIGDFDPAIFPIPKGLEDAIVEAYQQGYTSYPLADGELDLRQAIAAFYQQYLNLPYDAHEIQVASGGRPLIYTIFKTLVNPGDKVIYAVPSWNNNHYTNLNLAQHCLIDATLENHFMPTAAQVIPHLEGAALLCLCTPQNPTGTTLPQAELLQICQAVIAENERRRATDKKLYVLFDQMYWTLTFGQTQHHNPVGLLPAMKQYTIFVDGISKCFAATGVRVGWSAGPAPVIAKMKAILSHIGAWAPMAEQKATARFLTQTNAINEYLTGFKQAIEKRLTAIYNGLMALQNKGYAVNAVAPQAAIYLTIEFNLTGKKMPNGELLQTQAQVTQYLLETAGLAIVPFYAFGAPQNSSWYRLSVGTVRMEDIEPMFAKLEQALAYLR
ncbi:MAG TPA: aminotransferase class I/II-fold pyridoxal phosphate-dependent enzyme, partial [Phnomibacter sp.]|nr:aminotransferase class I/II-fold pyridoxal phosphate-dependent enzyme [Phnomibacter sp.]